jgi:hypothetical protein
MELSKSGRQGGGFINSVLSRMGDERSRHARSCSSAAFCFVLLLAGAAQEAKADFAGNFCLSNFTLTNLGGLHPNGYASSPDCLTLTSCPSSDTLVLTGTNDGSGLAGMTDFTVPLPSGDIFGFYVGSVDNTGGAGILTVTDFSAGSSGFQFTYSFTTADDPTYEYAGYLTGVPVSNGASLQSNNTTVLLTINGQTYNSVLYQLADGAGQSGAVAPEPGSLQLLLVAAVLTATARNRRRLRLLFRVRRVTAKVVTIITGAICLTAQLPAQQFFYTGTNVTGQLVLTNVVNASQQVQTTQQLRAFNSLGGAEILKSLPRLHPPVQGNGTQGAAKARASAQALPTTGLSIVPLSGVTGFNALSHMDQRLAYNGNQFSIEPPNQSIAVGNGYVLEGVNDAIQIFTTSGAPVLPIVLASNQLLGLPPGINYASNSYGVYLTDMRVFFDPGIDRWIVLQRSQDNDISGDPLNSSHLYIAVSQTADPTANYNIYIMNTTDSGNPGCPCIDDYPQIGADQYGFHVAWNEFNTSGLYMVGASILAISKASLASGAVQPTAVQFLMPYDTGYEFAIQPATTPPGASNYVASGGLEYFVSSQSNGEQGTAVSLWAMSNTSSLATPSPSVALTRVTIATQTYIPPDVATQMTGVTPLGSSLTPPAPLEFLDGGDNRIQALVYASGQLFLTLETAVVDQNGRSLVGGAYMVLSPTYRGALAAKVLNQGYLLVTGNHLLRPAIAVNAQGVGAIAVTLVGASWHPSAAFIPFASSATPSALEVAAAGSLPEDGFTGYAAYGGDGVARWGDYNTAVAASDGSIQMVVQYIGSYPRTQYANWNTYVFRYQE